MRALLVSTLAIAVAPCAGAEPPPAQPLGPGGAAGPWDERPPPAGPGAASVPDACAELLHWRDENTQWIGKTTVLLSAGWVGGRELGWFDQDRGGGPITGLGAYRDWGRSTVRRRVGGGCVLDIDASADGWRVMGGWSTGAWTPYRRLEAGGAYVRRLTADLSLGAGASAVVHGTGTASIGAGITPELRLTYSDWVGARAGCNLDLVGKSHFQRWSPQLLVEVFISKRLEEELSR